MPTAQKAAPIKAVPAPTQRPYTRRNSSGTLRFARGDAVMYPRMFITPPPRPKRPTNNSNRESNGNASFCFILARAARRRQGFLDNSRKIC